MIAILIIPWGRRVGTRGPPPRFSILCVNMVIAGILFSSDIRGSLYLEPGSQIRGLQGPGSKIMERCWPAPGVSAQRQRGMQGSMLEPREHTPHPSAPASRCCLVIQAWSSQTFSFFSRDPRNGNTFWRWNSLIPQSWRLFF